MTGPTTVSLSRAIALLFLLAAAACGRSGPVPPPESLSLLWISLDTLRADHLGLHGYERDTSPFLDELAARGLSFEWAVSPQGSTLPTHMTMFTGLHPLVHRVMHPTAEDHVTLSESVATLPVVLGEHGFRTRAWADGGQMKGIYGFARGFESYADRGELPLRFTLDEVIAALDELAPNERFFYLVHTYEIHDYEPPPPYASRYRPASRDKRGQTAAIYDGSIRFVDDELRRFIGELEQRGLLDTTIVVITSDHGENLGEYGIATLSHDGFNLHQNVTRVPWIVIHPDERVRGRVRELVGLIDFPSTVLALLGLDRTLLGNGRNVLDPDDRADREILSWSPGRVYGMEVEAWSLYSDDHHLLYSVQLPGPERNALYDIAADPLERVPLDDPAAAAALHARFEARRAELIAQRNALPESLAVRGERPASLEAELIALGYLAEDEDAPAADGDPEAAASDDAPRQPERSPAHPDRTP